jgi:transposase-like protein
MRPFVRIAAKWMYLFRAVDSHGQTVDFYLSETRDREAAKLFLKKTLANPDNRLPHVFARDALRSYPAALRELQAEGRVAPRCRQRAHRYCNNRIESDHPPRQAAITRDAGAADNTDGLGGDSGIRSSIHDSQRTGTRDYPP